MNRPGGPAFVVAQACAATCKSCRLRGTRASRVPGSRQHQRAGPTTELGVVSPGEPETHCGDRVCHAGQRREDKHPQNRARDVPVPTQRERGLHHAGAAREYQRNVERDQTQQMMCWVRGSCAGWLRPGSLVEEARQAAYEMVGGFVASENQLEHAIAFLLLEPGERDGEDEQHARSADRKRRGPRPALEPRDDAARQDGRNIHALPDRRLDGLGRAEQRMIRAQDRNAANAVRGRGVKRPSPHARESVAYRASIRDSSLVMAHPPRADQTSRLAVTIGMSEQPSCRATDGRRSPRGSPDANRTVVAAAKTRRPPAFRAHREQSHARRQRQLRLSQNAR